MRSPPIIAAILTALLIFPTLAFAAPLEVAPASIEVERVIFDHLLDEFASFEMPRLVVEESELAPAMVPPAPREMSDKYDLEVRQVLACHSICEANAYHVDWLVTAWTRLSLRERASGDGEHTGSTDNVKLRSPPLHASWVSRTEPALRAPC